MRSSLKPKKERWSLITQFWAAVVISFLAGVVLILCLKKSLWIELEAVVGVLSVFHFAYIYYLVYNGIKINSRDTYSIEWKPFTWNSLDYQHAGLYSGSGITTAFSDAGIAGCLVGVVLDIVLSLVMAVVVAFLLWLGMNLLTTGVLILFLPLFLLFRRSLRIAIARGRTCHRVAGNSLVVAGWTTILNMAWLYVVVYSGHLLRGMMPT